MALTSSPPRGEDLVARQIAYFLAQAARTTDFNVGSVVRSLIEAETRVLEEVGVGYWAALNQAVDSAVFDAWGFARRPAVSASGKVRLFVSPGVTPSTLNISIPVGQRLRVEGSATQVYVVTPPPGGGTAWTVTPAQGYIDVQVLCTTPGTIGNVRAEMITEALPPLPMIGQVVNTAAIGGGLDTASDADRRADFAAFVQSLPRGTVPALTFGVKTAALFDSAGLVVERVRKARVVEGGSAEAALVSSPGGGVPVGQVYVYVHNGASGTTGALITQGQAVIDGYTDSTGRIWDGWRPAGVPTIVQAAVEQLVNFNLSVTAARGYDPAQVAPLVGQAIRTTLAATDVGGTLGINALVAAVADVPGVQDFAFTTPVANVVPTTPNRVLVLGTLTGTCTRDATTVTIS